MERNYTIYGLKDPIDGVYKYIGCTIKPLNRRLDVHLASKSNQKKTEWISILRSKKLKPIINPIFQVYGTEQQAFDNEIFFIKTFRDIGHPLLNMTIGGRNNAPLSDESKKQLSESLKDAHRRNPSWREKSRLMWVGKSHTEETKKKLSDKSKAYWSKIPKEERTSPIAGKKHTEQTRAKMSAHHFSKGKHADRIITKFSKSVNQYDLNMILISTYKSLHEASRTTGVSYKTISRCAISLSNPRTYRNGTKSSKFIWRFA